MNKEYTKEELYTNYLINKMDAGMSGDVPEDLRKPFDPKTYKYKELTPP